MANKKVSDVIGNPEQHETITPGDTATGISAGLKVLADGENAEGALVTVEDNAINFCIHGASATAASGTNVGHELGAGQSVVLKSQGEVSNFNCIDRVSGNVGIVKVTVYY